MTQRSLWKAGVAIALLLLATEIVLRLTLGLGTPPLLERDSEIGYVFQANQDLQRFGNHIHINDFHQRSAPIDALPDSSVFRILFVGDSVTWGGVLLNQTETYPEQVRRNVRSLCADSVEALNASAGSWGIGNAEAYIRRFGTFGSDVVVLQIGSHDLLQATSTSSEVDSNPSMPSSNPWFATEELLSRYVWPRVMAHVGLAMPVRASNRTVEGEERFRENMRFFETAVGQIRDEGATPVVLYTPDRNEVVESPSGYADTYIHYRSSFFAIADSLDTSVVDALTFWRSGDNPAALFRDGVHPNAKGHQSLALLLSGWLEETTCAAGQRE